jgi:hypothetical protein
MRGVSASTPSRGSLQSTSHITHDAGIHVLDSDELNRKKEGEEGRREFLEETLSNLSFFPSFFL